jgi:hypothetical protein
MKEIVEQFEKSIKDLVRKLWPTLVAQEMLKLAKEQDKPQQTTKWNPTSGKPPPVKSKAYLSKLGNGYTLASLEMLLAKYGSKKAAAAAIGIHDRTFERRYAVAVAAS